MTLRSVVRHVVRRGSRIAVVVPEWAGFGNQLYYYFHVDRLQRSGVDAYAVPSERGRAWLDHFPSIRESLTRAPSEIRFFDRIDTTDWNELGAFGVHYSRDDLTRFVETHLLSIPALRHPDLSERVLTINVRRGDYYSDPAVRGTLGFDQLAFLSTALERYAATRPRPALIHVVSDDPGWCAIRLGFLSDFADRVTFNSPDSRPIDDFCAVARANDLVITNSTFSVWAAHAASLRGGDDALVIAPAFGTRPHRGRWVPLDPEWTIIDEIPGGWDS